jgi:predicted RNA polymerase sigma factor
MASPVVELNRAVAYGMAFGADAGLTQIEAVAEHPALRYYAPLSAARADMLARAGRKAEARTAFEAAARLTRNSRERAWLSARARECEAALTKP